MGNCKIILSSCLSNLGKTNNHLILSHIFGQMSLASDPKIAHVSHHRLQNSLNIDFTGIHTLEYLFSIELSLK